MLRALGLAALLAGVAGWGGPILGFSLTGETWTYNPGDGGAVITGILATPATNGQLPAVLISHGKGGSATGFSLEKARVMTNWGLVCIGPNYTHAGSGSVPDDEGYSPENSRRARACLTLLGALGYVDTNRLAAYGNSMGAFLTAGLCGELPHAFRAAAITAGGTTGTTQTNVASPAVQEVQGIRAPMLLLHGTADTTVPPAQSAHLQAILASNGVPHSRVLFDGIGHDLHRNPASSNEVLRLIREWFETWGVLGAAGPTPAIRLSAGRDGLDLVLWWSNLLGDRFRVERTVAPAAGAAWLPLQTNLLGGSNGITCWRHPNALAAEAGFYRVGLVEPSAFVPHDVPVGDPTVNYANVEFTPEGNYMVGFEGTTDGSGLGTVWHCGVNRDTGELVPPDGKGFAAFLSTLWGRANPGSDASGPYYVGLNRAGQLVLVRPVSATNGTVTILPTAADPLRRAVYPTVLPDRPAGYVFWIRNESVPGGGASDLNAWFELQYLHLHNPTTLHVVERQDNPPGPTMAAMDIGFARWARGRPALTYGFFDPRGNVQSRELDLDHAHPVPVPVTNDDHNHIDPFTFRFGDLDLYLAGLDGTATIGVYARAAGETLLVRRETVTAPATLLTNAALAQSAEPIIWDGRAFLTWQINESGSGFFDTAFARVGEIWLATLQQSPPRQWRLSAASDLARAEPEPLVGTTRVWVFYSATSPGANVLTTTWNLRRADTPLVSPATAGTPRAAGRGRGPGPSSGVSRCRSHCQRRRGKPAYFMVNLKGTHETPVAQVSNLLYRRFPIESAGCWEG